MRCRKMNALCGVLLLLLTVLLQGLAPRMAYARAQIDPADALIATVTPKPWEMPLASIAPTVARATDQPTAMPTPTMPPSSLSELEAEEPTQTPTPTPTPAPTPAPTPIQHAQLPGVLGLENPSVFRVLLIGTDAYKPKDAGRSDTMVVFQINVSTGEMKMVSFLRDLYVQIPDHGKTRLNAAYVYGGSELLKRTIQSNFNITVDRTLAVNFSLMVDVIDRIGGVTVDVSEKERRQLNSILKFYNTHNGFKQKDQLLAEAGTQLLSGKQALCYSRIRKIDSDFQRTGRQRKVLIAIYARVREMDAYTLAGMLADTLPQVTTDMTLADAVALVPVLMKLDAVSFDGLTVPIVGGYKSITVKDMEVLSPDLDANRDAIAQFLQ